MQKSLLEQAKEEYKMIIVRNLIRKALSDQETTDKIYEKLRNDFTNLQETYNQSKKEEMALAYDDILHLVNLLDALTTNTIQERERMDSIIESLVKSQEMKDDTIKKLQEEVQARNKELAEFKEKHGTQLGWIDNWFKRESRTSPK